MSVLVEVFKGLGYSGVGFLVGYQVCKIRRNTEEIKEAIVPDDGSEPTWPAVERRKSSKKTDRMTRAIGIFVIALSLATVGQSVYFSQTQNVLDKREKDRTACQAQYNEDFARAVTIRGQYADEDRTELYKMITSVMNPNGTVVTRRAAVEGWVIATQKNDQLRKATPLPNLQARNC
jgi:hypothetical protein